jgi:hypothetical protein
MTEEEAKLQRRIFILRDALRDGKLSFSPHLNMRESLIKIRQLPNGDIDLTSVDAKVRSLALAVTALHDREEMKKIIPLNEIQQTYFNYIEENFGLYYSLMKEKQLNAHDVGLVASNKQTSIDEILPLIPEFITVIKEFWDTVGDVAWAHIEDSRCLKGVYGGSLFPTFNENLASKCGIYTDTLVIPDPFLRTVDLMERWADHQTVYYFLKHAMQLMEYKDLALAEIDTPIVVVLPDSTIREFSLDLISSLGKKDSLIHGSRIFNREFESFEQFKEFCTSLDTVEKVLSEIQEPDRLLFDSQWGRGAETQLTTMLQSSDSDVLQTKHPGLIAGISCMGRMIQANEILIKSRRLNGIPIIDADTSWQFFNWKLEYDAQQFDAQQFEQLHVTKGLQNLAKNEMTWLGCIPPEALIELRKDGAVDEIRSILNSGISEIIEMRPNNFFRSTDKVMENIQSAFAEHEKNLKTLSDKKWKFAGADIGSWIAVGTLELAAAGTGTPLFGMLALAANQFIDAPKLKELPGKYKDLLEEDKKKNRSPVGLLFSYSKNS